MTERAGPRFHGRRHGRRLRGGRRTLLETLLPEVRLVPPSQTGAMDRSALFPGPMNDIWLEIGFGAGEHLAAMAVRHPDIGFIGCEPYVNGVAGLLARIARDGCRNVRVFDDDARLLLPHLPEHCAGRVFLLFPDPWPKHRHAHRRFISAATLDQLARVMRPGGEFRFATDDGNYVGWTLEHVVRHPAFVWAPSGCDDWRRRPVDAVPTRYEQKALARGVGCTYLRFVRRAALPGAPCAREPTAHEQQLDGKPDLRRTEGR